MDESTLIKVLAQEPPSRVRLSLDVSLGDINKAVRLAEHLLETGVLEGQQAGALRACLCRLKKRQAGLIKRLDVAQTNG